VFFLDKKTVIEYNSYVNVKNERSLQMAVPKKRTSKAKRNMRRSHDGISAPSFIVEADGTVRRPHRVNLETGLYRGRKVLADAKEEKEAE